MDINNIFFSFFVVYSRGCGNSGKARKAADRLKNGKRKR